MFCQSSDSVQKQASGRIRSLCAFVLLLGCSTTRVHMQSVRACGVEAHFSIFSLLLKTASKRVPFGVHFGDHFHGKKGYTTQAEKTCQPKWKLTDRFLGSPVTATLYAHFFCEKQQLEHKLQELLLDLVFFHKIPQTKED